MEPSLSSLALSVDGASAEDRSEQFDFAYLLATPLWVFDIDHSRILQANDAACALWDAKNETDLRARDLGADMSPVVRDRLKQYQADFHEGATFNECWTLFPHGEPVHLIAFFQGFLLPDGRMGLLVEAHVKDAAETPENMRSSEALLHTDIMITLFQRAGEALYMNPAARKAAVSAHQMLADLFVDVRDHDILMFELDRKGEHALVAKIYTSDGLRWHNLTATFCTDTVTGAPAILVTSQDVSDLKNAEDQARYLADRDQLTGCFNRTYLQQSLAELAQFQPQECALLCFDIDRFKLINDRYGHEAGDVLLRTLASRMQTAVSRYDMVVRLGGDEFVILFTGIADRATVIAEANALREALAAPILHNTVPLATTASMGLAFFRPGQDSHTEVMREADIALHASKTSGRNKLTVFDQALGEAAKARDQVEIDLRAAIERDEFVLFFQPRTDLATGKILSVEALVRWQHPTRGLVAPGAFIPVCEETGMILQVGRIVLKKGLAQIEAWHRAAVDIDISINISPVQFEDPSLMQTLREHAERPEFPTSKVELEITENVLVDDHIRLARSLSELSRLGYRIAIDDFGAGYSNLSYISNFPVDCIKIDKSFIFGLPDTGPVILLILTLARQLGAYTVAEGIETKAQANWLIEKECDQAQGFLYHRPMALDDLMRLLA